MSVSPSGVYFTTFHDPQKDMIPHKLHSLNILSCRFNQMYPNSVFNVPTHCERLLGTAVSPDFSTLKHATLTYLFLKK